MTRARPSTPEDVLDLAPRLRKEDVAEVWAINQCSGLKALQDGLMASDECLTIEDDAGKVVGMFGVAPLEKGVGAIWLLASDDLPRVRKEFLRQTRPWVQYFQTRYPVLTNMVDARNEVHIKWIKWAGFTFTNRQETVGPDGVQFLEFYKLRDPACATLLPSLLSPSY